MAKQLPHSIEAEKAVLGAMLMDPAATAKALSTLDTEYFFSRSNAKIFEAIETLASIENASVDITSIVEQLRCTGNLELVGGIAYLADVMQSVATSTNVEYHAQIIQTKYQLRKMIHDASGLIDKAMSESGNPAELVDGFLTGCAGVYRESDSGLLQIMQYISPALEQVEVVSKTRVPRDVVRVDLSDFDRKFSGLPKYELTTLAARTSIGKTSLALQIAQSTALRGEGVAFFSLEMSGNQLALRAICSMANVSQTAAKRGTVNREEMDRLVEAANAFYAAPLYIDETAIQTVGQIRAKVKALIAETPISLIVVDHIQFVEVKKNRRDSTRAEDVSNVTRGLKALAKETGAAVLAISHLRRPREGKDDAVPLLVELKESGSIEQDSGMVLFLHRERAMGAIKPETEFIIAKNRTGPTGIVYLCFQEEYTRFEQLSKQDENRDYTTHEDVIAGVDNLPF